MPVFVMLSGAFALESYSAMKPFFVRTLHRIVLPFVAWSLIYLFYFSYKQLSAFQHQPLALLRFIWQQIWEGTASHLWFVYMLLCLYLTFPLLKKLTINWSGKEYLYFLSLWIFLILFKPFISTFDTSLETDFFSGYIGFIILGNYLNKKAITIPSQIPVLTFSCAFLYTAVRTYNASLSAHDMNETHMENLSLNVILMSASIFVFFRNETFFTSKRARNFINLICEHSFGIYLSHLLILNVFLSAGWQFTFVHPLLAIPFITLVCLLVSLVLIILLKKIPLLKDVAG